MICSARTYTRDYQDMVAAWAEADVPVWGTVSERVSIAAGPAGWLSYDGLEAYRSVWRRVLHGEPRLSHARPHLAPVRRCDGQQGVLRRCARTARRRTRVMEFGDVVGYGVEGRPTFWLGPNATW